MNKLPSPKMTACQSSQVSAHGYDPATSTLVVKYNNGGTYHYSGVPAEKYAELQKSKSVGGFLHSHIKGKHDFKKIEDKPKK